ncbi:phospholipase A1-like [Chrysoperla carnea]|uniref:phospholipase A1-like n=1 Tax=Chrysoperla carnea TaxID=189513 RepID=UPI001D07AF84|nr:phospholipase A1-like [Chrysoperla carnea]
MYTNTFLKLFLTIISLIVLINNVQSDECFKAPNVCPNENVTFWLYTRNEQNGKEIDIHNFKNLNKQLLDKDKRIKILIHGFRSNRNDAFNMETRKALFQLDDFYVISVNWTPLTQNGCRETSSLNTRVVGNCTANFIEKILQHGISLENIHVIGFSLGAQTAGFVTPNLKDGKKVYRVTGLDPTLPHFNTTDLSQRLDASDGVCVDVIHTAAGIRGQIVPSGTIDFYMNDAQDQPGCKKGDQNEDNPHICSHKRSFEYFAESVNSKVGFDGHECEFKDDLPLVNCAEETTVPAGYHTFCGNSGVYQVNTAAKSPFALGKNA